MRGGTLGFPPTAAAGRCFDCKNGRLAQSCILCRISSFGFIGKNMSRPSWETYFMDIAFLVAKRATCLRRQVGAIAVTDKRILATGYNGAPSGLAHCLEVGCLREELGVPSGERHELCRGLHAEQNVIIQAAYHGVSIKGATLYCTNLPCSICSKMLINAGIGHIVYEEGYADSMTEEMLQAAGVTLTRMDRA
jgi:dCMP deaminase